MPNVYDSWMGSLIRAGTFCAFRFVFVYADPRTRRVRRRNSFFRSWQTGAKTCRGFLYSYIYTLSSESDAVLPSLDYSSGFQVLSFFLGARALGRQLETVSLPARKTNGNKQTSSRHRPIGRHDRRLAVAYWAPTFTCTGDSRRRGVAASDSHSGM